MLSREDFAKALAPMPLTAADRAVALLWFYRQTQEFDERSASELGADLHALGFPRPNVTRLKQDLARSQYVTKGKRPGTFQLDVRRIQVLDTRYASVVNLPKQPKSHSVLDLPSFAQARQYLRRMAEQINSTYDTGSYDACAVMCRRMMESLVIELFISAQREAEIKDSDGRFLDLDVLLGKVEANNSFNLSRGSLKSMRPVKDLGDTAAHDRVYLTKQSDIDDIKPRVRKLIDDLMAAAKLTQT